MEIVLDNIIYSLQRAGGISVYWSELSRRLLAQDIAPRFLESQGSELNFFRQGLAIAPDRIIRDATTLPVALQRYRDVFIAESEPFLFHSSYYRRCSNPRAIQVVTVHDCTYELFRRGPAKWIHCTQKHRALKAADGIICVSENTRRDLLMLYPELRCKRIAVIHNGKGRFVPVAEGAVAALCRQKELVHKGFVLFVGDRRSYKNFGFAASVVQSCPHLSLAIVGGGALNAAEARRLQSMLPGRFRHLGMVSDDDLNLLYNGAFCLLYPSSYEGFGIPVIEAMAAGCPVVALRASSIPEISGDAGLLISRLEPSEVRRLLVQLELAAFRDEVVQRGLANARRFSWDACFDELRAFYGEMSGVHLSI